MYIPWVKGSDGASIFLWHIIIKTHLKTALKTKTFEKIYFIRFYWISNTNVSFALFKFFWSDTWKSKINKCQDWGLVLITAWGPDFFFKKISLVGPFIWDLKVPQSVMKKRFLKKRQIIWQIRYDVCQIRKNPRIS